MMKRLIVITSSRTGFTRRYGDWLAEMTGAKHFDWGKAEQSDLSAADVLILGSPVHGAELDHLKGMKKLAKQYPDKKILYFAVGIYPPSETNTKRLLRYNFPEAPETPLFYLPGGMNKDKLIPRDQAMRIVYKAMLKRQRSADSDDSLAIDRMTINGDYTDRDSLMPLIEAINEI